MDVHLVTRDGVRDCSPEQLPSLVAGQEGLVWVDVPTWDEETADLLGRVFHFHPLALRDCATRNCLPKVHAYPDVLFIVLHAPERGAGGHIHYVELDRFIGPGFLVTVHGPLDPAVPLDVARRDTRDVLERLRSGRLRPRTSFDISHAVVSTMTRRMESFVEDLTEDVWELERRVTGGELEDPERFLDRLFRARQGSSPSAPSQPSPGRSTGGSPPSPPGSSPPRAATSSTTSSTSSAGSADRPTRRRSTCRV